MAVGCHDQNGRGEKSVAVRRFWIACVAAFVFAGITAIAEDGIDLQALQAKLAAQEALLNDIEAKMLEENGGEDKNVADGIVSMRKNATVTIGGQLYTRYISHKGTIDTKYAIDDNGNLANADGSNGPVGSGKRVRVIDSRYSQFDIMDAKLEGKIDVSEHFDAYFKFDLQDGTRGSVSNAQNYWMRWKNVCNSGFGLLVGRDSVKFGMDQVYGHYDTWVHSTGDKSDSLWDDSWMVTDPFDTDSPAPWGMAIDGSVGLPVRAVCGNSRTTQITPYWENKDGSFKFELSFFQTIENEFGNADYTTSRGVNKRRRVNYGVGSFSSRVKWEPIEGLHLTGSVMNLHAKNYNGGLWSSPEAGDFWFDDGSGAARLKSSKNNFATALGFEYRPSFMNKVNLYATWIHSWNDGWVKDQDTDTLSFGFGVDLIENLTVYAIVDHINAKSDQSFILNKAIGWGSELGVHYEFPYGVALDAGWRHERMTFKDKTGDKHTRAKGDGFYVGAGFEF